MTDDPKTEPSGYVVADVRDLKTDAEIEEFPRKMMAAMRERSAEARRRREQQSK